MQAWELEREWGKAQDKVEILEKKLEDLKPILKQIEQKTNSRAPRVSLEALHLNEQWFRVWEILGSRDSEVNPE